MVRPHKTYLPSLLVFNVYLPILENYVRRMAFYYLESPKKLSKNSEKKKKKWAPSLLGSFLGLPGQLASLADFVRNIGEDNFPNLGHLVCMFVKFPKDESFFIRRLISHFWMSRDSIIMDCKQGNHMARDFDNLYHFFIASRCICIVKSIGLLSYKMGWVI